jgi:hypothetical protein
LSEQQSTPRNTSGEPPPRRSLILLAWAPINRGPLAGRARVLLPCQLEISDIGVFVQGNMRWCQLPSELLRDSDGAVLKDNRGKLRYRSALKWATRDLQERFSHTLIELIEATHGPVGGGAP